MALALFLVVPMALLGACGDDDGGGALGGGGTAGGGGGNGDGGSDRVKVVLEGGADDGTYERTGDAHCSVGFAGEGMWGNQYSDAALTDGLTSVQVIVPDFADGPASEFNATATIGPFLEGGTEYDITSGTATVDDSGGDTASVQIAGETDDGVSVEVEIDCATVIRA